MNAHYVVIGKLASSKVDSDSFVCQNLKEQDVFTIEEAKELKKELDTLNSNTYYYHVAQITFLD